jgi:hypothetical protein
LGVVRHTSRRASGGTDIFHRIKFYAVEVAATVAFVWIVARALWHELGF